MGGAGGILYCSESTFWKYKTGLGRSTNNRAEVIALKLILMLAVKKRIQKLQVMGNSKVVIDWITGISAMRNFHLKPIFGEINNLKNSIN
jgi:ribonuclease HI